MEITHMIPQLIYTLILLGIAGISILLSVIAYFYSDSVVPSFLIFLISFAVLYLIISLWDKKRVKAHDEKVHQTVESMNNGDYYRSTGWQNAYREYKNTHQLTDTAGSRITNRVKSFYKYAFSNLTGAALLTLIVVTYLTMTGLFGSMFSEYPEWYCRLALILGLPAIIYYASLNMIGFVTTVPYKQWKNKQHFSKSFTLDDIEKLMNSGKYIAAHNSLIIFGNKHVLLSNRTGTIFLPYENIREIGQAVHVRPMYISTSRYGKKRYEGLGYSNKLIISFVTKEEDLIPQFWKPLRSYWTPFLGKYEVSELFSDGISADFGSPGFSTAFTFNTYQIKMIIDEFDRRGIFHQSEQKDMTLFFENEEPSLIDTLSHSNISDFF